MSYLLVVLASALILINNNQVHRILEIFYVEIHNKEREITYVKELYLVCTVSGLVTFGMALYSTLSIKFGFKLIIFQFALVLVLQIVAMVAESPAFMVVIYVYDGLFKGGMFLIMYEITAELAFPVGESLSLGLLNAIQYGGRFLINFMQLMLVYPLTGPDLHKRQHDLIWLYIVLMVLYCGFTITAIYLVYRSEFKMHRFQEDACLEAAGGEGTENREQQHMDPISEEQTLTEESF